MNALFAAPPTPQLRAAAAAPQLRAAAIQAGFEPRFVRTRLVDHAQAQCFRRIEARTREHQPPRLHDADSSGRRGA